MSHDLELLYFSDPMCSWCWGFSPIMNRLKTRFEQQIPCSTVMGGLHTGESPALVEEYRNILQQHWREVEAKTGQPFDYQRAAPLGSVYNTEPPSRALVLVRRLAPHYEFEYLWSLQKAFYQDACDLSEVTILIDLAKEYGVEESAFVERFDSPTLKMATNMDFQLAREIQARAFPCIVLRADHDYTFVSVGYQEYEMLEPLIAGWLDKHTV